MDLRIIETVEFRLAEGVAEGDFIRSTIAVTTFLKKCRGFKRSCLSRGDNDNWLEHVEWQTLADAKAASEAFLQEDSLHPYMAAIDSKTVKMDYHYLYHLAMPGASDMLDVA